MKEWCLIIVKKQQAYHIAGVILLTVLVAFQVISAPPKEITAYQLTVDGKEYLR